MQTNIGLFLAKRAQLSPNLEAYVGPETGQRLTYDELNARCNQTAHALHDAGVRPGDRVALLLLNGSEYLESFFAVAKLGAVVVPLNWRLVADELGFILKDSGSKTLIFGEEFAGAAQALRAGGAAMTDVERWIYAGAPANQPDFAENYADMHQHASTSEPVIGAAEEALLYIMYTSGTTGLPKGAVHTHNSAAWACMNILASAEMRFKDRYLNGLPLYHVGALTPATVAVYAGQTSILMRAFDPVRTWQLIEEEKVTSMLAVPAMLNFMLQVPGIDKVDTSLLRWIMSGAAPVPVTLIEAYQKLGIEIHQVYGLTESCGPGCIIGPDDAMARAGSTGHAYFHTDIRIINEEGGDCTPNEPGEVLIRGKHNMKEYWNRPDATAETLRDGWLYTGDIAIQDEDGFVYIQDRVKDMVISGGENVYPAEIENVILAHPKVKEVGVIGQPSEKWGESPFAVVVAEDGVTEADVLSHCQGKLAPFKMPKGVGFVDEIPRNPTGKMLKRILREQFPGPAPD